MKFSVITLFPDFIKNLEQYSIVGRAIRNKKIFLKTFNLRDFGLGSYHQVDDKPYGGGAGMLLRVDVALSAIKKARSKSKKSKVILLSAGGEKFTQSKVEEYSQLDELIILCAHYEGHDARIEDYVDEVVSIGDFVVSGGEIPALIVIDSVSRLIKGVLGKEESLLYESFSKIEGVNGRVLEFPQYTRPDEFERKRVPEILLSGNHEKIEQWKRSHLKKIV